MLLTPGKVGFYTIVLLGHYYFFFIYALQATFKEEIIELLLFLRYHGPIECVLNGTSPVTAQHSVGNANFWRETAGWSTLTDIDFSSLFRSSQEYNCISQSVILLC